MNYYGDIPLDHLELLEELKSLEEWFNDQGSDIPSLLIAKGFVAMACDYYAMEMDEEGERLLKRAEEYRPGYFKRSLMIHVEQDKDYAYLVSKLQKSLGLEIMISLGFKNEQV